MYFTEFTVTLVEGSFRQEYSSMCIARPERYREATGNLSHPVEIVTSFIRFSDQNQEKIVSNKCLSCLQEIFLCGKQPAANQVLSTHCKIFSLFSVARTEAV